MARLGGNSLPFFGVFDASGRALFAHSGRNDLEDFRTTLRKAEATDKRLVALRAAANEDRAKARELLAAQIALRHFEPAVLRKRLADVEGLPEVERAPLAKKIDEFEFANLLGLVVAGTVPSTGCADRYEAMRKTGAKPVPLTGGTFWYLVGMSAVESKDSALLDRSIAGLREVRSWVQGAVRQRIEQPIRMLTAAAERLRKSSR